MKNSRLVKGGSLLVMLCLLVVSSGFSQAWVPHSLSGQHYFSSVSFFDALTGWISGAEGVVFKTVDGGLTWTLKPTGTSRHFSDHYFVSANIGWVVGENGTIRTTTDGGESWAYQPSGTTAWLNVVRFVDAQTGWAAGSNGKILKTTNGGNTWTSQSSGTTATIEGGDFVDGNKAFLATSRGAILATNNGGASWNIVYSLQNNSLNALTMVTPLIGYATGAAGKIVKTTDGGLSWVVQNSGTHASMNAISFSTPDIGWVVGDCGIVRATTNGGATWFSQSSPTAEDLRSVFFNSAERGWAVGLNSAIIEYDIAHPVPVQLASFTAVALSDFSVRLNWMTISEINNFGFEVQRASGNAEDFATLPGSFLPGHGTTNQPRHYTYTDFNVPAGRHFYRLKQIDLDGTIHYTEPVAVDVMTDVGERQLPATYSLGQNYPNPFNPSTNIEFSIAQPGFVSLIVYDILGKQVATLVNEEMHQGTFKRTFKANGLSSGVYWYRLKAGNFVEVRKFILSK